MVKLLDACQIMSERRKIENIEQNNCNLFRCVFMFHFDFDQYRKSVIIFLKTNIYSSRYYGYLHGFTLFQHQIELFPKL